VNTMRTSTILAAVLTAASIAAATPTVTLAVPVKLLPDGQIGSGTREATPGDFDFPESVATSPAGTIYVADDSNGRIQELAANGEFVAMFGWEVNATKDGEPGSTQAEKNVCTAASKDACQAGTEGTAAGQFSAPEGVTVDPASGNVYVADRVSGVVRVQEFTAAGRFVLEIGHDVNKTTRGNLCTAEEVEKTAVTCGAPTAGAKAEHDSFYFHQENGGDILAMGGSEDLLYVGEENRVQELHADGEWAGEISLTAISAVSGWDVRALALDDATSDLYLVYSNEVSEFNVVHEFSPAGQELKEFDVNPREAGKEVIIRALAVDGEGHLAVTASERIEGGVEFGVLYAATTGRPITSFTVPASAFLSGLGFDGTGELFAVSETDAQVLKFRPVNVAELAATPAVCAAGGEHETDVLLNCALGGEANPEGVAETTVWFEWGRSPLLGERTPAQSVAAAGAVNEPLDGLRPNETFYERLAGEDANVKAPETLRSETASFSTPPVAPVIVGQPSVSFVGPFSAVLSGELNPENARTHYLFQYAPACEPSAACPAIGQAPGAAQTAVLESSVYGRIAATLEAKGLEPRTGYRYELLAESENDEGTKKLSAVPGAEGTFTTAPVPVPSAASGVASALTAAGATISGSVDPDGRPATYALELGLYEGTATSFGIVSSGAAGAGSVPVAETLGLSGLEPDTTYAYRISVKSGYTPGGQALVGETMLFTTLGLPSVLSISTPLAMLTVPRTSFPSAATAAPGKSGSGTKTKTKKQHAKLRTCTKANRGHGRAGCRAQTHKASRGKRGHKR
jgi:DNA-binding beta-propeller fold protein YncE